MPVTQTVYARGDSATANNGAINSQNPNTVPVTELRFEATDGGDILLDYNGGLSDPDTVLYVNGVQTTFTVEFTGTMPNTKKFSDINGEDLRGEPVVVITDDDTGQRYYFFTDRIVSADTMAALPNGSIRLDAVDEMPPPVAICFAADTLVDTPAGPRVIGTIVPGDIVLTDRGPQPVRWIGKRTVSGAELAATPTLRPVRIAAGALSAGCPSADIVVSANHRIYLSGWAVELAIGRPGALVAAKHLAGRPGITQICPPDGITYVHLLFDSHSLVTTSGLVSESFAPGPVGLATLSPSARRDVARIAVDPGAHAHRHISLRQHEARALPALA